MSRPAPGPAPLSRLTRLGLATVLSALALLGAGCTSESSDLAKDAVISASSSGSGSPKDLVDTGSVTDPGSDWVSRAEGAGAWIEMSWVRPVSVSRLSIVVPTESDQRVSAGLLNFGDGSSLGVRLDPTGRSTILDFPARKISSLRFTVSALVDGATVAGLSEVVIGTSPSASAAESGAAADGNAAGSATVSTSVGPDDESAAALTDAASSSGADDLGKSWSTSFKTGDTWVELAWPRPHELASAQLAGSGADTIAHGRLEFSDGSTVAIGGVSGASDEPTTVAFMPRMTSTVRLVVDQATGGGQIGLSEFRAYEAGAMPARPTSAASPSNDLEAPNPPCTPADPTAAASGAIAVSCPQPNSVVSGRGTVQFAAPGLTSVSASLWASDQTTPVSSTETPVGADGIGTVEIDFAAAPRGPLTVVLAGAGGRSGSDPTRLQLYNASKPAAAVVVPPSDLATGRTLVYDEEFDERLSISRDGRGADYAAAKPNRSGAEDFGDAIFPDPSLGFDNLQVVDERYLRIKVEPNPAGYQDPNPWNRSHVGGLLASARTGGSGFSAQYGYFEARMLAPVAPGTWPAFWTLPAPNLAVAQPVEAEVDAVELYGNDPLQTCHSTHQHSGGEDDANTQCKKTFSSAEAALGWHTYGVDVTPVGITYFVDGKQVATAPQITGGDQPMFFMVNLALGGGWPVKLDTVANRAALYVDYVRVYT